MQAFEGDYKWILYGDDDTFFFVDGVLELLQDFDPSLPYFITGIPYLELLQHHALMSQICLHRMIQQLCYVGMTEHGCHCCVVHIDRAEGHMQWHALGCISHPRCDCLSQQQW